MHSLHFWKFAETCMCVSYAPGIISYMLLLSCKESHAGGCGMEVSWERGNHQTRAVPTRHRQPHQRTAWEIQNAACIHIYDIGVLMYDTFLKVTAPAFVYSGTCGTIYIYIYHTYVYIKLVSCYCCAVKSVPRGGGWCGVSWERGNHHTRVVCQQTATPTTTTQRLRVLLSR